MAVITSYAPYDYDFNPSGRAVYAPASLSSYVAPGGTVPDTTITAATPIGLTRVRLPLAVAVPSDSTWTTAGNYVITESGGAAAVTVSSAAVGHDGSYVDLATTSHTASGSYSVAWSGLTGIANGSDAYTPTALPAGRAITLGSGVSGWTIVGNSLPGGTISYTAGTATVTGNDAYSIVS